MAQLPPKVPNMPPPTNWPDISHHQRIPSMDTLTPPPNTTTQTPSWVDEFLDFSSTKRGSHRRSASDSIAFLEVPGGSRSAMEFDRFDEEQFMSMFIVDDGAVGPGGSTPSSPSDHNSMSDQDNRQVGESDQLLMQQQLKSEGGGEVQSSCGSDGQLTPNSSDDKIFDPKRIKRILANRQSAQRSRVRKLQYISELERSVNSLQTEVSVLSPRVAFLDHQRLVLNVDNSVLKQRIAALAQDKLFKDAHQEAMKREIERLRQLYYQQNLKKMDNNTTPSDVNCSTQQEQIMTN
ncbi:hypothetical protein LguiB_029672 [Lonicera macranthoides]